MATLGTTTGIDLHRCLNTVPASQRAAFAADLEEGGKLLRCERCDGLNAHAWGDCDEALGIAHIPVASCWEWQCGHCGTHWVEADSPINHPAYTHADD